MRNLTAVLVLACAFAFLSPRAFSQDSATATTASAQVAVTPSAPVSFDQVIDRVIQRERFFNLSMRRLHPLVETYIQNLKVDRELGPQAVSDQYFLGRLDMSGGLDDKTFMGQPGFSHRFMSKLSEVYSLKFLPLGFAQMVLVDQDFERKYYDFAYVRREFLGEVRCIVIDVQPKKHAGDGRFIGRIWVEDQDYNIVRFNGTYTSRGHDRVYLHFDSWRLNMRPGEWLPAYVYSEESGDKVKMGKSFRFRAQTRLWGYDLQRLGSSDSFTQILVDSPQSVQDQSPASQDASPVESARLWEREAEDNALDRLQRIGLLAPAGEVDKVLQTVVNNLIVTNNLNIEPEVRVRVLLTTPLESFTVGHTIVISRGLLDVLPDEPSLAMVLAHELGHIALGQPSDTSLAFNDRLFFPDEDAFQDMDFGRDAADEEAADKEALQLLANSPYKDNLSSAGLFLKALQEAAPELKNLIRPHLGNGLAHGESIRMSALLNAAPKLEERKLTQLAALPLGSRIRMEPWSGRIDLIKTKAVSLTTPEEKMPFGLTPFFPYLTRYGNPGAEKVAQTAPVK
ncbi:MAG TPA: M48 family metalloprotease [Terriglobales bacterium]|nr:M48 family metalloprotease [Terriglobales bacterium]